MADRKRKRKTNAARRRAPRKWSAEVMRRSHALDLEEDVFKLSSPAQIAASLKRSAEASERRKGTALQSAMAMLSFYINRAGRNLPPTRKRLLERAKPELRKAFTVATNVKVYFCDPASRGSADPTRTRTVCCASTSERNELVGLYPVRA